MAARGLWSPKAASGGTPGVVHAADNENAVNICVKNGGHVFTRVPVFNTGAAQSAWLYLMGEEKFCQFTSPTDGSRIHITLETLNSTKPSLAALAYYSKLPPATLPEGLANPASQYCTQLGGSDLFGGISASGGAWVNLTAIPDVKLEACIFPDMSSIDSWGLFYHANDIIRGIDLATVLQYQP